MDCVKNLKFGIIGNHGITIKCLQCMARYEEVEICFVIFDLSRQNPGNSVKDYCDAHGLASFGMNNINTTECIDLIGKSKPDIILSISNYWIMDKKILSLAKNGVLNFHNGPPSNYRGINIPSWVIMNGEKKHGVMWHFADEGIDRGDVVGYEMFDVGQDETAATLMVKCIKVGLSLFMDIFPNILSGQLKRFPQKKIAPYYSLKDQPENGGFIDFRWPFKKIDQIVRGLNYFPFSNPYCYAKLRNMHGDIIVNKVSRISDRMNNSKVGQVIEIAHDKMRVACGDSVINIESCMDENHIGIDSFELARRLNVEVGSVLYF